ncbi:MAG: hypothetical protein AAGF11_18135 [Myxococcota bacterium]
MPDPTPHATVVVPNLPEPDAASGDPELPAVADALSLDPGATCLEHDRLTEQVVSWLERDQIDPRLSVVVEGNPTEAHTVHITLWTHGKVIAERVFAPGPHRCEDLHAVVSLAIAHALDATVLESVGSSAPDAEAIEPPPPQPPVESAREVVTPATPTSEPNPGPGPDLTPRPSPWDWRLHGGAMVTIGAPRPIGGGVQLGIELGWRDRIDVQVGGLVMSAGRQPVEEGTIDITLMAGRADVCTGFRVERVRPRLCGGFLAGSAYGRARGYYRDFETVVRWVAVPIGGDVRVDLTRRLAFSFDVDGLITLINPIFDMEEELQVRKLRDLPPFAVTFGVGLVVGFGEGHRGAGP